MKGLMIVAIPIDTDNADPALALRTTLHAARGVGPAGEEMGRAQVVTKEYVDPTPPLPDDYDPAKAVTANDLQHLTALGFDTQPIGSNAGPNQRPTP